MLIGFRDALVEHGARGCGLDGGGEGAAESGGFRAIGDEDDAGFGAELADALGDGGGDLVGDFRGFFFEGGGEDDDGVEAAHFGEDGDGIRAGGGGIEELAASGEGAGEADGAGARVFHEWEADGAAGALEHGENAGGEIEGGDGFCDGGGDEFGGSGVGLVGFDDDGVSGGEGGGGVAAGDGEGEGEIASTEDDDWADGGEVAAEVGFGDGGAIGDGGFDAGVLPGVGAGLGGEHAELATGAAALAEKSWFGEAALEACAVDEIGAERFDFIGDGFEEACAGFAIGGAEGGEGLVGCFHGEVDLGFAGGFEIAGKGGEVDG